MAYGAAVKGVGGKKGRSGRKTRAEEMGLKALLDKCWTRQQREDCIRSLASTANNPAHEDRMDAVKLLMSYTFGKPKESVEHSGKDGEAFEIIVKHVTGSPQTGPN